jgi:very-short-patch-repair endonuclease
LEEKGKGDESGTAMSTTTTHTAKELARELRKRQTRAEAILWEQLRNREFLGKKFLRQHPLLFEYMGRRAFFIADFYCHERRLVIEVDGKKHDYQRDYDELRTQVIDSLGIAVVRVKNEDIESNIDKVLERIRGIVGSAKFSVHP